MPVCLYPSIVAPEKSAPDYSLTGQPETNLGIQQGFIVVPGEVIFSSMSNLITGHGTYRNLDLQAIESFKDVDEHSDANSGIIRNQVSDNSKNQILTSLTGRVRIVNKLVYVDPPKARYYGNVGDTIVGRIIEVEQRRWRVDVNSALLSNLALANVKLPGGELRRKSEDDERAMRSFMKEGDLIIAEVHEVYKDGTLQLHMPGTRTGKLGGGCLLKVPPSLIKRQKIHRHSLAIPRADAIDKINMGISNDAISVGVILGCNGYVWIGPARAMDIGLGLSAPSESVFKADQQEMLAERYAVCRVRNCILALSRNGVPVWETSILAACEASWFADCDDKMEVDDNAGSFNQIDNVIARLLHPEVSRRLVSIAQAKLNSTY